MRVLITQPVADAAAVAAALQDRGHHAFTTPVITVERTPAPTVKLEGAQGFIVTSRDGARALAETISVRTFPVFADSATTASELSRLGFKNIKAARDDSADLARLIEKTANPNAGAFIYACSTSAPVQLGALLSNMGFALRALPLYSTKRVERISPEMHKILESGNLDAAVFLSADEARAFVTLIQREKLEPLVESLKTIAANPIVAAPLRALKLGAVVVPPSGDLETVFGVLDQKLVDKVEQEKHERARAAREIAEQQEAEDKRRAEEKAEQDRLRREQAEQEHAEQMRAAAEKAERDQAARDKAEQERLAKEKEAADKAERKRLAKEQAAQEKEARRQTKLNLEARAREEKERLAQVKADRARALKEQAAKEAEDARVEREKQNEARRTAEDAERKRQEAVRADEDRKAAENAAQEKAAKERAEHERLAQEIADQERVERERLALEATEMTAHAQKQKADEERRAADDAEAKRQERAQAEEDRLAAETAAQKRADDAKAEQDRLAKEQAERERQKAESAEMERMATEAKARRRAEKEQAGRDRRAARSAAREAAKMQRVERAQLKKIEKEEAEKKRQKAKAAARAEREKTPVETARNLNTPVENAETPSAGLVGKFKAWRARRGPAESTGPMYTRLQGQPAAETETSKPNVNADVAIMTPSVTIVPPVATAAPDLTTVYEPPPQSQEEQNVSQEPPQEPTDSPAVPKDSPTAPPSASKATSPAPSTVRGGGRAERLRAEDAADQKAGQQRYKNFGIGDSSSDTTSNTTASSTTDQGSSIQTPPPKTTGGIGKVVALFILLVVAATAIIGTASWWVPHATQLVRGQSSSGGSEPVQQVQTVPPAPTTPAPETAPTLPPTPSAGSNAIQTRLEALERNMAGADSEALSAMQAEFNNRLEALEQSGGMDDASVTSISESLSSQARQLAAVSARLATLEAAIGNAARVEDLNNRIIVLEGKSADAASVLSLANRVTTLEDTSRRAVAEQTAEVALLMATAQLREAIAGGQPFALELETAKALSLRVLGTPLNDDGFATYGARGIPSLITLQRRFDETAARVVRAAAIPDGASGWLRQSLDRLMAIVTVRRIDGDIAGDGASAVLARAGNRLGAGDLTGAAVEMTALTGAAAEAAAPWLADVRARIAADRTITSTLNRTMALMAVDEHSQAPAAATDPTSSDESE